VRHSETDQEHYLSEEPREYQKIQQLRDVELGEVASIFRGYGLEGPALDQESPPARYEIIAWGNDHDLAAIDLCGSCIVQYAPVLLNWSNEVIAAPGDIDDEPIPITSVTQCAAQCRNMYGEVGRLDE
jgi:hypothetical protein